ncbi:MAG: hypothetical protein M1818_006251 [Claussenomyces sp. TS43310]|nr:MAG: hypothetical protein M1818_006251 [Claussenomyces sp. TS43310]
MSTSRGAHSSLIGLVESEDDDVQGQTRNTMPVRNSTTENMPVVKKGRGGKAVASKISKPKPPARRTSGRGKKARQALADKTNEQHEQSDTEEVDDFDQGDVTVLDNVTSADELDAFPVAGESKKARSTKTRSTTKPTISTTATKSSREYSGRMVPNAKRGARKEATTAAEPMCQDGTILETQVSTMDVDENGDEEVEEVEEPTLRPVARRTDVVRSGSRSRQTSISRRRAGSASDTERSDPAMRRKLGYMTKKYEQLDLKYQNLREVGVQQAEDKFEKLKKQSEESRKAANGLITSLKAEIATQNTQLAESRALKRQHQKQDAELAKLQAKVAELVASLAESNAENKTLSAKLAANRIAAASVESASAKIPGSAVKTNGGIRMMGSAEAAQAAQIAQLKEDFYSDLTGLIVRGVKRDLEEDVYDCIQTGRNGTLHFKLAVANDKVSESYDDAQCVYVPQLDPSRDRELIGMLPDYLVEEITFPRPHAAKFYGRVVKALMEKSSGAPQREVP